MAEGIRHGWIDYGDVTGTKRAANPDRAPSDFLAQAHTLFLALRGVVVLRDDLELYCGKIGEKPRFSDDQRVNAVARLDALGHLIDDESLLLMDNSSVRNQVVLGVCSFAHRVRDLFR